MKIEEFRGELGYKIEELDKRGTNTTPIHRAECEYASTILCILEEKFNSLFKWEKPEGLDKLKGKFVFIKFKGPMDKECIEIGHFLSCSQIFIHENPLGGIYEIARESIVGYMEMG